MAFVFICVHLWFFIPSVFSQEPSRGIDLEQYGRSPYPAGTLAGVKALREPAESEVNAKPPPGGRFFRDRAAIFYAELRKQYPETSTIHVGDYLTPLAFEHVLAFYSAVLKKLPQGADEDRKLFILKGTAEAPVNYVEVIAIPSDITPEMQQKHFGMVGVKTEVHLVRLARP